MGNFYKEKVSSEEINAWLSKENRRFRITAEHI